MRLLLTAFLLLSPLPAFSQEANTTVLTLVNEEAFNQLKIDLEVALGDSTATSTLTGTLNVRLNIDHTWETTPLIPMDSPWMPTPSTLRARSFRNPENLIPRNIASSSTKARWTEARPSSAPPPTYITTFPRNLSKVPGPAPAA